MPTLRFAFPCAAALFLLFSCNNNKKDTGNETRQSPSPSNSIANPQEEILNIPGFQKGFEELVTQRFTAAANNVTVVTAAKGLKVTVDPSVLEKENGSPVNDVINVNIIELTNSEDLFKSDAATVSDGKLLMSGGSYYIGMESGGQQLHIRRGNTLQVEFPKLRKEEMKLFYGQRDSLNSMNWKPVGESLEDVDSSLAFSDTYYTKDSVYTRTVEVQEDRSQYSYGVLSGRVFRDMKSSVMFYGKEITLGQLLDTVNKHEPLLCLDSVSFWPPNLPKNTVLDTNYLVASYGPRFQFMLKRCECNDPVEKKAPYMRTDTFIMRRDISTLAEQVQKYYAPEQVSSLGWINCDRYYNTPESDMQFQLPVTFNNNTSIQYFVLFKKFSGLMKGIVKVNERNNIIIEKLPVNEDIMLIAFTKSKGTIYQAKMNLRTCAGKANALDFKEISTAEMNTMFGRNVRI